MRAMADESTREERTATLFGRVRQSVKARAIAYAAANDWSLSVALDRLLDEHLPRAEPVPTGKGKQ